MKFFLFGSLRTQKRRARDIDLIVELEPGDTVGDAMASVAQMAPRARKPVELWLTRSESEPNVAGNYDPKTDRWAFWRRPGLPGFFTGLEPVTLDQVVRLAHVAGPHGPIRRSGSPTPGCQPECSVRNTPEGWRYELDGERGGPFPGPLEAAAAAEAAAKAGGRLGPAQVLWFRLRTD